MENYNAILLLNEYMNESRLMKRTYIFTQGEMCDRSEKTSRKHGEHAEKSLFKISIVIPSTDAEVE